MYSSPPPPYAFPDIKPYSLLFEPTSSQREPFCGTAPRATTGISRPTRGARVILIVARAAKRVGTSARLGSSEAEGPVGLEVVGRHESAGPL